MIKIIILATSLFALVSCGDGINKRFSAFGDDPMWNLDISVDRQVRFSMKGLDKDIVFDMGEEKYIEFLHKHKEGDILFEFNILDRECHNYIKEKTNTNQVIIRLNGEKYLGCGEFKE